MGVPARNLARREEADRLGAAARAWKEAWADRSFRVHLAIGPTALVLSLAAFSRFALWIERRPGATLADPLLEQLVARDLTWLTFGLIYLALAAAVSSLAAHPRRLITAMEAYAMMVAFRMLGMWLTPLDPPPEMIGLRDPLVEGIGTGQLLTRDLFFSGHTATVSLLAFAASNPRLRAALYLCAALVGGCVLWQHVHYAVDVFAAPFVAYASWRLAGRVGPLRDPSSRTP